LVLLTRGRLTKEALDFGKETTWPPDLWLHSVLPPAVLLMLSNSRRLRALALGWLWHNLIDIAWHRTDARPPAYPLLLQRFHSPFSNSEGEHVRAVIAVEALLCLLAVRSLRRP